MTIIFTPLYFAPLFFPDPLVVGELEVIEDDPWVGTVTFVQAHSQGVFQKYFSVLRKDPSQATGEFSKNFILNFIINF